MPLVYTNTERPTPFLNERHLGAPRRQIVPVQESVDGAVTSYKRLLLLLLMSIEGVSGVAAKPIGYIGLENMEENETSDRLRGIQ